MQKFRYLVLKVCILSSIPSTSYLSLRFVQAFLAGNQKFNPIQPNRLYYFLKARKSCSFIKIAIISTQIGAQLLIIHLKTLPFTFNNDLRKHCWICNLNLRQKCDSSQACMFNSWKNICTYYTHKKIKTKIYYPASCNVL